MGEAKSYEISKKVVWEAYKRVKANRGAAGVDGQSIEMFEEDLKGNLYKIWLEEQASVADCANAASGRGTSTGLLGDSAFGPRSGFAEVASGLDIVGSVAFSCVRRRGSTVRLWRMDAGSRDCDRGSCNAASAACASAVVAGFAGAAWGFRCTVMGSPLGTRGPGTGASSPR
jgi:hypothetical protein